jgi:hypothetical protein
VGRSWAVRSSGPHSNKDPGSSSSKVRVRIRTAEGARVPRQCSSVEG